MIHQKELLLDISELAAQIEEEFGSVFKPYLRGWYLRHDTLPIMPAFDDSGQPLAYHMKGGLTKSPWDENITEVTDPNLADRDIYNQMGDLIITIKPIVNKNASKTLPIRYSFTQIPTIPCRGIEVIVGYFNWCIDHSIVWRNSQRNLSDYLKDVFAKERLEEAEIVEVTQEINESKQQLVPTVFRYNALMDALIERLQLYCLELRRTLDAFTRLDGWQTYSMELRAHTHIHLKKLGDYRILEWTRLKNDGTI